MAKRLKKKAGAVNLFISSPAIRAKNTCEHFCKIFEVDPSSILFIEELYQAPAPVFYTVIAELENQYDSIAVFSHNPGITHFVNSLVSDVQIDNMPTCGIFAVQAPIHSWKDFSSAQKKFLFFDYPKSL